MRGDKKLNLIEQNAWGLRFCRLGQGKTQSQVSEVAQISLRNYQRIESGEVVPKITTLFQILQALNVTITDFFSSFPEKTPAMKAKGFSEYKLLDLMELYRSLRVENSHSDRVQIEKLKKYVNKGKFGLEKENSISTCDVEGIETNHNMKTVFNLNKQKYNYDEFSTITAAHSALGTIINTHEEGDCFILNYPSNFNGAPVIARFYGCLVKKSWDNPLVVSICEIAGNESELLGIIQKVALEDYIQKSIG